MSKYQIGQKVRVAFAETLEGSGYVGRVGTITEIYSGHFEDVYGLDITPLEEDYFENVVWGWGEDQLTPAIPPHEASQYSYTELMDRLKAGEGVPA